MEAIAKLRNYPTSPRKMRLLADMIRGMQVEKALAKTIMVDGARVLKRMRPAPQGRGYRVRKRSNHVTIVVDSKATV
jgi:large subunit ribosomal protein L22